MKNIFMRRKKKAGALPRSKPNRHRSKVPLESRKRGKGINGEKYTRNPG
jgi:hypothetical protein